MTARTKSTRTIRVSEDVWQKLKEHAKSINAPFASPDNILRHMLQLPQAERKRIDPQEHGLLK